MSYNKNHPKKWIAARKNSLDPVKDYDEIWKLSSAYHANDFVMNLIYAVTFPHFFVRELDALPLWDEGRGKILERSDARADDTSWKMQVWWNYGSSHEKTVRNVESINRLHEHYAKKYPESFSRNGTYIYTLCYEAAGMHRLLRRVGLKGFSEKEKIASTVYWTRMAENFRNAGTGQPLVGFPTTFDGIMKFMDEWEGEDVPIHPYGAPAAAAIMQQFADRYFHTVFHPLIFKWLASLYPEHILKAFSIKKPSRFTVYFMRKLTAGFFWFGEHILPDPVDTFEERRQRRLDEKRDNQATPAKEEPSGLQGACPFLHNKLQQDASDKK